MTEAINGLKELNRALKDLEAKVANKIIRAGIAEGAKVLRKQFKAAAPVHDGTLRKSMSFKIRRLGRQGYSASVGPTKKGFYARFIEYGSSPHRIPGETAGRGRSKRKNNARVVFGGRVLSAVHHPGTTPRPFLRPTWDRAKAEVQEAMKRRIWEMIKAEATKKQ